MGMLVVYKAGQCIWGCEVGCLGGMVLAQMHGPYRR